MQPTKSNILDYLLNIKDEFRLLGIEQIALFGSYATNNANIYSDIDIAIKKQKKYLRNYSAYDYFDTINSIKLNLKNKFHKNIDILDLDSNSPFLNDIKKELIYV